MGERSQNNRKMILEILTKHEVTSKEFMKIIEKLKERISILESKELESHSETLRIIEKHLRKDSSHLREKVTEIVRREIEKIKIDCCNSTTTTTTEPELKGRTRRRTTTNND